MAIATVGGESIKVDLPNFKALKAAWRHISEANTNSDPMEGVTAILGVISVGAVDRKITVEELEDKLRPNEMLALQTFLTDLMVETGIAAKPGENEPAGETANPSTQPASGSTPSSPKSSEVSAQ